MALLAIGSLARSLARLPSHYGARVDTFTLEIVAIARLAYDNRGHKASTRRERNHWRRSKEDETHLAVCVVVAHKRESEWPHCCSQEAS